MLSGVKEPVNRNSPVFSGLLIHVNIPEESMGNTASLKAGGPCLNPSEK
jgi:hypothetical protein